MEPALSCHCVFPSPREDELITIPGTAAGTAFRVFVETGRDGYIRLQQMAYDAGLGWYVQKSIVIPGEVLAVMLPQLRKAQCLMSPAPARPQPAPTIPFLRLVEPDEPDQPLPRCGS